MLLIGNVRAYLCNFKRQAGSRSLSGQYGAHRRFRVVAWRDWMVRVYKLQDSGFFFTLRSTSVGGTFSPANSTKGEHENISYRSEVIHRDVYKVHL